MFSLILSPLQLADALSYLGSRLEQWEVEFRTELHRTSNDASSISPPLLRGSTIFVPKAAVSEAQAGLLALLHRIQSRCNHRDALRAERALTPVLRQIAAHGVKPGTTDEAGPSALPGRAERSGTASPTLLPLALEPQHLKAALPLLGSDLHLWRNAIRAGLKPGGREGHRFDASVDGPLLHDGAILVARRHLAWMLDALEDLAPKSDKPSFARVATALEPVRQAILRLRAAS